MALAGTVEALLGERRTVNPLFRLVTTSSTLLLS